MFKIKKGLSLPFLLSALFTSCNPIKVENERDESKLYLGSYKTVTVYDMENNSKVQLYDYYMYIRFLNEKEEFVSNEDFSYDLEIDLNTSGLENFSSNSECAFFDLAEKFSSMNQWNSYKTIKEYFEAKNYISVFTSVGKLNLRSPMKSRKMKIQHSGYIYSFNSIKRDGESLNFNMSEVFKESYYLFDVKVK